MSVTFIYTRGEAINVDLVVKDPGSYTPGSLTVSMDLKKAVGTSIPSNTAPVIASFDVSYVAPSGNNSGYWRGIITANTSSSMSTGMYITDAVIKQGANTLIVTDPVLINLAESVTA